MSDPAADRPAPAVAALGDLLGRVSFDAADLEKYGRDWSRLHRPDAAAVAFPADVDEVQTLVRHANRERIALVPSGGRTGMSGGATAAAGEVVVSFERMNRIESFEPNTGAAVCQPGVITETLQQFARERGWFYPVDFGARGSSQIGGNIATNAGGIKVLRYGMTRQWVTGLRVVTGSGDLLELNRGLIKNATGYDLRQLFIGSEGTLGFIVGATIQFTRPPRQPTVLLLAVPELEQIMPIFSTFSRAMTLSAFECFTDRCLRHVVGHGHGGRDPFERRYPYYALLEFDADADTSRRALELFEECSERGRVADGVVSENDRQIAELWRLRDGITAAIAEHAPYKNDVSVPVASVSDFLRDLDDLLGREYPDFEVLYFGHVGDGNLHVNVLKPAALPRQRFVERCEDVNRLLFETVRRFGGSISAEHGVGLTKKPYLHYSREPLEVDYMRALKRVFDPNGIMNPGKIFD